MKIDDESLFTFMQEVKSTLGRIEANQSNTGEHLQAVSDKASRIERKLDIHKDDNDAHGLKEFRGSINTGKSDTRGWIAIAIAGLSLLWSKFGHTH